jgi:hypothetical protein
MIFLMVGVKPYYLSPAIIVLLRILVLGPVFKIILKKVTAK